MAFAPKSVERSALLIIAQSGVDCSEYLELDGDGSLRASISNVEGRGMEMFSG